jgi:hypothetical protein
MMPYLYALAHDRNLHSHIRTCPESTRKEMSVLPLAFIIPDRRSQSSSLSTIQITFLPQITFACSVQDSN